MTSARRQGLKVETNNSRGAGEDKDGRDNRESGDYGNSQTHLEFSRFGDTAVKKLGLHPFHSLHSLHFQS